ncbi:MAG: asparagine synthase (glutamine-hydrolyzing) [Candidatus Omnitrophica bacterium]|nr:asparagine synthase (glutamine-hydrolyzing) [Candidatus Omnitrophota bacterium]
MCGICGTKGIALENLKEEQAAMLASLNLRGPDEWGQFCDANEDLFLGATRLSIIDLTSTGSQPLFNEDQTLVLVCNGEIYNAPALREELVQRGHRFYSKTDIEVIIHLYEEMGEHCLDKLKGMFAFALWDKQNKVLFVARDRLGIKPLYYFKGGEKFAFASEIKALLKLPFIKKEIDPKSLDLYFSLEYVPAPFSIYKNIRKLKPGSYLILKDSELRVQPYWGLGSHEDGKSPGFREAAEHLEHLLKTAVREHLLADVPVGVLLSGGVDSSVLAALACREMPGGCDTFSMGFDEKTFDETEYAEKVARFLGSRHHHHLFSLEDFIEIFPFVTGQLDEPLGDLSVFPTYFLSRFTRQYVKTAFSGEGGDELFMGYPTYLAHKFLEDNEQVPAGLITGLFRVLEKIFPVSAEYFSPGFKIRQFLRGEKCLKDPVARHLCWMGSFSDAEKKGIFSPDFKNKLASSLPEEAALKFLTEQGDRDALKKIQYCDFYGYLAEDLLVKADRASMAASLELRVPYLDHELVEFVWGLPADMIFQKRLFKSVAAKYLPPEILRRTKKGFSIPFTQWLEAKSFFSCVEEFFTTDYIRKQGLFDAAAVRQMYREHAERKKDHRKKIGTYIMFQSWHRSR